MNTRFGLVSALAVLGAPIWGANLGRPGVVNYIEGQVAVDGRAVAGSSAGTTAVEQGQILETQHGKAEILLTPGVFLRLGNNSEVRMVSPELTDTQVELLRGHAMIEVAQIYKQNNIRILEDGATTTLQKNGLYRFDADNATVGVVDGQAAVREGDTQIELKKGKETAVSGPLKAEKFDRKAEDDLYRWSSLRSGYLSEASASSARTLVVNNSPWGGGWFWSPFYSTYSFIPGDGFFYSPFGYGFYSPRYISYAPIYVGRGYLRGGRPVVGQALVPASRGITAAPSMRSSMTMSRGLSAGGGRRR